MPRFDVAAFPDAVKPMLALEAYLKESGLDRTLVHLVQIRASQINGCALCLDMHTAEARRHGESEIRIYMLPAWRESSRYTPRERAALAWTEAMTLIADTRAPDDVYEELRAHFDEKECVDLSLAVVAINGWNRLSIGSRAVPLSERAKAA